MSKVYYKFTSFRYSDVLNLVKKRWNGSRAPRCTNRADKNYNIATLVTIIIMSLYLYWHIENTGIVRTVYSGIFRDIQQYLGIFRHYWGVWSHNQTYLELCVTLAYTTVPYSELRQRHLQKLVKHVRWSCMFRALA